MIQGTNIRKPDFLIIGAQKSGTTWLWRNLDLHPGTDLPKTKEIHYFGGAEHNNKGRDWYYGHFRELDRSKVIGEASTTYFFDYLPYFYNNSNVIEYDKSKPSVPEMISKELPDIKIILVLRDPVDRAVSAYKHWLKRMKNKAPSPFLGIKKTALMNPKWRILEYGYYARYLRLWEKYIPKERFKVFLFEEAVVREPQKAITQLYDYLGLDSNFTPQSIRTSVHKSWTMTRIIFNYYVSSFGSRIQGKVDKYIGPFWDRVDFLKKYANRRDDISFLRSIYLPEKEKLESLIGRELEYWDYGASNI